MNCVCGKWFEKYLRSSLTVIALIISLSSSPGTVLAADDPATDPDKATQAALEIPGSFKELSEARDAVTAKRSVEAIALVEQSSPASAQLTIDADKLARPGANRVSSTDAAKVATYASDQMVDFHATAYCLKGRTASGIHTRPGVIAADPNVLPLGTVVHLSAGSYTGTYTVMDTGGRIKGRRVDVYVPTYKEAVQFGRRQVKIKVIGRNTTKAAIKSLLAAEF